MSLCLLLSLASEASVVLLWILVHRIAMVDAEVSKHG